VAKLWSIFEEEASLSDAIKCDRIEEYDLKPERDLW
jgi:hypothetical protein